MGPGGFQETEQLPIFSKITKYQGHVSTPRDHFNGVVDADITGPRAVKRGPGGESSLDEAAALLAQAKFPVIVSGGGVVFHNK